MSGEAQREMTRDEYIAELAALFDIASGYHKKWQRAEEENARMREGVALLKETNARMDEALPKAPGAFLTLAQLREIEWGARSSDDVHWMECPACFAMGTHVSWQENSQSGTHAPDCWLAAAVKRAEGKDAE